MPQAIDEHIFIINDGTEEIQKLTTLFINEGYDVKSLTEISLIKLLKLNFGGSIIAGQKHFEVANSISQNYPNTPIIFFAKNDKEKDQAFQYNFHDLISTPLHSKEICNRLNNISNIVSSKKHIENETKSPYSRIAKAFNECFISVSEEGDITDISASFEETFSISKDTLLGKNIEALFQNKEEYKAFQDQLKNKGSVRDFQITLQGSDGLTYWVELSGAFRFNDYGRFLGIDGIIKDVTEAKLAEKDREQMLEQIIEEMNRSEEATEELNNFLYAVDEHALISVTDQQGIITYVNDKFCTVAQYTKEELIGSNHKKLNSGHHDHFFWEILWDTILTGKVWKGEVLNKAKDGTLFWEHTTIVPFKDKTGKIEKFVSLRTDITELKRKEEEIKARELKFNTLFDSSSDTVILMQDKHFKDCNFSTLQMFGLPSLSQFLKSDITQLSPDRQPNGALSSSEFEQNFEFANRTGNCRFEWLFKDIASNEFFGEVIIDKMPLQGNVSFQVVIRDITTRKIAEDELIRAKNIAEQASQDKANFLSVMSHEIRTPINAVIGITHLLLENNPKKDQLNNLETLMFSSQNLLSLINDILDFSKIEAGKIDFEKTEFDLINNLENLAKTFNFNTNEENNLAFVTDINKNLPSSIIGDPGRLTQILTNLLGNAFKFTAEGTITLKVKTDVRSEKNTRIYFEVADTGIGIDQNKLEHIFQSFSQEKSDTTRKYGGTGLGLAITKRLIELQGSKIKVESIVGEGTKFSFSLDYELGTKERQKLSSLHKGVNEIKDLHGLKLLLVEDNQFNVMVVKQFLQKWGLEITHASNGLEAYYLAKDNIYDIILMDLQMPEMDGYEATRRIRKLNGEQYQKTPIIALTAEALSDIKAKVIDAGMNDYITKPFNPTELNDKIYSYTLKNKKIPQTA